MFKTIKHARAAKAVTVVLVAADKKVPAAHKEAAKSPGFNADNGEIVGAGAHALLLGVGAAKDITPVSLRNAAARLVKHLHRRGNAVTSAHVNLNGVLKGKRHEIERLGRAFGEALHIANWRFAGLEGSATKKTPSKGALAIDSNDADFNAGLAAGMTLGNAINFSRTLGATPPNICNPAWVAAEARKLAREAGLKCTVIDHAKAKRLGMGGLVTVGHGSASKSCLIHLVHKPRRVSRKARGEKLVLVGKTLTYDTGGYSLKVNNGMKGMKYDKLGGTAVLGAMMAIADLDLPIEVHAVLAAAENMVSDDSMRPDDIIRISNGVTVEITNTDAEGRLVLADALVYADKTIGATQIVDMATLTGGVVVALGHFSAGYFCNHDGLRARLEQASEQTGEKIWRLPLWNEHRDFMRAQHADLLNSNPARSAHPIQGAAFLSFFVDESTPWAHIDIAGVGNVDSSSDLHAPGPTGYGVRLLTELAADLAG
jgi:leucyl aminopeptidase